MDRAILLEMDHEAKEVFKEELRTLQEDQVTRHLMVPSDDAVTSRVTSPIVHTYVDTDKISFERYTTFVIVLEISLEKYWLVRCIGIKVDFGVGGQTRRNLSTVEIAKFLVPVTLNWLRKRELNTSPLKIRARLLVRAFCSIHYWPLAKLKKRAMRRYV